MIKHLARRGIQFAKLHNLKLQKFGSTDPIVLKFSPDWAYHVFQHREFGGCSWTVAFISTKKPSEKGILKD